MSSLTPLHQFTSFPVYQYTNIPIYAADFPA